MNFHGGDDVKHALKETGGNDSSFDQYDQTVNNIPTPTNICTKLNADSSSLAGADENASQGKQSSSSLSFR